ncbi:hypothetical protein CLU96_3885 [Chryseobacterium sp. 52]|uniref:hypothetical protein n=1 Tax=Chryseobacterium sp. 52 TaxID=2035213 RepID=UPI000C1A1F35|nr:hypothetical protein [Chryseobacterium sp. 52]PIF46843.1 hypothetical protein CLU96_3885 [Chryseobacterium sp. 52]
MKNFVLQLFILGSFIFSLTGCNSKNDPVKTPAADSLLQKPQADQKISKNHHSETKSSDDPDETFRSLPKEWTMLTKEGSKYIIYIPCDYQNQKILLSNHGKYALEHIIGQDAYYFQIKNIRKEGNTYLFELHEENAEKGKEDVQYTLDIKDNNQAVWGVYNDERKMRAITTTDSRFENKYKTVEEPPCLE